MQFFSVYAQRQQSGDFLMLYGKQYILNPLLATKYISCSPYKEVLHTNYKYSNVILTIAVRSALFYTISQYTTSEKYDKYDV